MLYILIVALVIGCGERSSEKAESTNDKITEVAADGKGGVAVKDTLQYYLRQKEKIPSSLYQRIFGHELSDIEEAYVYEIKKPVQSFVPVVVVFKTVESDREKEYIDLHLFDGDGNLKESVSLDYEIPYDLFRQEHRFVNDSVIEIHQFEGLSYNNDSTIKTTFTLRIERKKVFDTIDMRLDTIY